MEKITARITIQFIFIMMLALNFQSLAATPTQTAIEITKIADLSSIPLNGAKWQFFTPVIGEPSHYFMATNSGKIYTFDDLSIAEQAFFDLEKLLPNSNVKNLTALTIDSSFNYRDRDGYQSFYTAHVETARSDQKKLTINGENLPFDAVIMHWHLDRTNRITPQISAQREVLRIAIPAVEQGIVQLSFDPFIEPWHANFGLLYIALTSSSLTPEQPLSSGAILRINPNKFGLRQYTTPENNPFTKNAAISDEIIILGVQALQSFNWFKNGGSQLVLKHNSGQNQVLSLANIGDNWFDNPNLKHLWQQQQNEVDFQYIFYRGRNLKNLWGNALLFQNINQQWQVHSSPLVSAQAENNLPLTFQGNLVHQAINPNAKYSVFQTAKNELLLFEHTNRILFAIVPPKLPSFVTATPTKPVAESSHSGFWLILALLAISSSALYRYKTSQNRHLRDTAWVNFDIDHAGQAIRLYKKRSSDAEKSLAIDSLIASELILNDTVISLVDKMPKNGFSLAIEENIQARFAQEQRQKMIANKKRKVQLKLTDNQDNSYVICLYFRLGNIRMTKMKYAKVIENVIDWHWLFAQKINPEATAKRKIKIALTNISNKTKTTKAHHPMPSTSHNQPAANSTSAHQNASNSTTEENGKISANVDTELVDALDKLAELRKQGYLDEQEFNTAKAKILQDLLN